MKHDGAQITSWFVTPEKHQRTAAELSGTFGHDQQRGSDLWVIKAGKRRQTTLKRPKKETNEDTTSRGSQRRWCRRQGWSTDPESGFLSQRHQSSLSLRISFLESNKAALLSGLSGSSWDPSAPTPRSSEQQEEPPQPGD